MWLQKYLSSGKLRTIWVLEVKRATRKKKRFLSDALNCQKNKAAFRDEAGDTPTHQTPLSSAVTTLVSKNSTVNCLVFSRQRTNFYQRFGSFSQKWILSKESWLRPRLNPTPVATPFFSRNLTHPFQTLHTSPQSNQNRRSRALTQITKRPRNETKYMFRV